MQEEEAAEGEVDRLGQREVLARLGQRDDLRMRRRSRSPGHFVPGQRVAVDCVDAPVAADHLGQRDRYVSAAGTDVGAAPAEADAEALQRGGQWPPVDVVAETLQLTHEAGPHPPAPSRPRTLRVGRSGWDPRAR